MLKLRIRERTKRTSDGIKTFWVGEYVSGNDEGKIEIDYVLAPWVETGIAPKEGSLYGCQIIKTKESMYRGKLVVVNFFIPIGEILRDEGAKMEIYYGKGNMDFHDRRVGKVLFPPQERGEYFLPLEKVRDEKIIKEAKIYIDKSFVSVNEGTETIEFPLKGRLDGNKIVPCDSMRINYYVRPQEEFLSFSGKDMVISGPCFCRTAMEILLPDPYVPTPAKCMSCEVGHASSIFLDVRRGEGVLEGEKHDSLTPFLGLFALPLCDKCKEELATKGLSFGGTVYWYRVAMASTVSVEDAFQGKERVKAKTLYYGGYRETELERAYVDSLILKK